jgi:DNA modification methylase
MLEIDKIYEDDSFNVFPKIDDESIDLVICDGPSTGSKKGS